MGRSCDIMRKDRICVRLTCLRQAGAEPTYNIYFDLKINIYRRCVMSDMTNDFILDIDVDTPFGDIHIHYDDNGEKDDDND